MHCVCRNEGSDKLFGCLFIIPKVHMCGNKKNWTLVVVTWEVLNELRVHGGATIIVCLSLVLPLGFHFYLSFCCKALVHWQRTCSANRHVFTWEEKIIQGKLTHNSLVFQDPDIHRRSPGCACRWTLMGQMHTSCYLYLYSIFSLQLASTHSFHSNGLGGIEDWKWHTGHLVSLSPTFALSLTLSWGRRCVG